MKRLCGALVALVFAAMAGLCAFAGTFDDYYDFELADGTYAYAFPRVLISLDELWYRNTRVVTGENGSTFSFYHTGSYEAYAAEGLDGGRLFTIGASVNTDFEELPGFVFLGFDEEDAMNYYAVLPTDYQAYMGDEEIRAQYDELWSGVEDVLDGILIKGTEEYKELRKSSETEKTEEPPISQVQKNIAGDYEYAVNKDEETVTITAYTGAEEDVEIPAELDGYKVTAIGYQAFTYKEMKSVSFPESIRSIGERSFEYCTISDALRLPEGAAIRKDAFSYAVLPSEVIIPAGVMVGECAFSYCETMEKLFVGPDVVIGGRAFGYSYDLKQVICAAGSVLETDAFEYCKDLERAVLCGDVEIQEEAFSYCDIVRVTEAEAGEYDSLMTAAPGSDMPTDPSPDDAGEITLEILDSPATLDDVTVTLETATAGKTDTGGFSYSFSGTIENNSDEGIMQVIYTFALLDENGEEFRSFGEVYDGEDTAIPPHSAITFSHDDIRWGPQSVPAAVSFGISSVATETELPPAHIPQEGEYLYQALGDEKLANIREEPPVELSFHVDQGGYGRTATFKTGEALGEAVERFCDIKIGAESGEWVTDNYNWITLTWADGSYTGISLNLSNLEYFVHSTIHTYELENLDEFWSFAAGYLTEDS